MKGFALKERKPVEIGDSVVWFGFGKTGDGSAVFSRPPSRSPDLAFKIVKIDPNLDQITLRDEYNGVTIHRNQVLKVYRKKPEPRQFFLKRTCSNPGHQVTIETKDKVLLDIITKEVWALCDKCDFITV